MVTTQPINQPASPGLWDQTYNAATDAANWISAKSKTAAASASDLASRAWAAITDAVSSIAQFFAHYVNVAKEALVAAKDHFAALPMNVKVVASAGLVLTAAAAYFIGKSCVPTVTATSTTTTQVPVANATTAPAADAAPAANAAPAATAAPALAAPAGNP